MFRMVRRFVLIAVALVSGTVCCPSPDNPGHRPLPSRAVPDSDEPEPLASLRALAQLVGSGSCLDPLVDRLSRAHLVLLGEASHGTAEFYTKRATISRRLIEEHGFRFIAVEGDWATLHSLNLYVKHWPDTGPSARDIMNGFVRWPVWMWANEETLTLIEWLREFNGNRSIGERVGFYGMDVYGMEGAHDAVVAGLAMLDPMLGERIRGVYAPLKAFRDDPGRYPRALAAGAPSLEQAASRGVALVAEHAAELREHCSYKALHIEQSAAVVQSAERHYRAMTRQNADSWNERADHFYRVVERLLAFYGNKSRGIVWAHNTHVGDARATPMAGQGRRNIGQTARERLGRERVAILGFGTHRGTVKAGRQWGAPHERMTVPAALENTHEDWMNRLNMPVALFLFDAVSVPAALRVPRGHRAIGVVYRPEPESHGQYVPSVLPDRYDAFLFIARTRALTPLKL